MLTFYQLNTYKKDIVSLAEAERVVALLSNKDGEAYATLPTNLVEAYNLYASAVNDINMLTSVQLHQLLFRLTWMVREHADSNVRKQSFSENYPFEHMASKLGFNPSYITVEENGVQCS